MSALHQPVVVLRLSASCGVGPCGAAAAFTVLDPEATDLAARTRAACW
jgi:hypothetical protein